MGENSRQEFKEEIGNILFFVVIAILGGAGVGLIVGLFAIESGAKQESFIPIVIAFAILGFVVVLILKRNTLANLTAKYTLSDIALEVACSICNWKICSRVDWADGSLANHFRAFDISHSIRCLQGMVSQGAMTAESSDLTHPYGGYDVWLKTERFRCPKHGEFTVTEKKTADKPSRQSPE